MPQPHRQEVGEKAVEISVEDALSVGNIAVDVAELEGHEQKTVSPTSRDFVLFVVT